MMTKNYVREKKSILWTLIKPVMPLIIPSQYNWLILVINLILNGYILEIVRSSMNFICGIYSRIFAIGAYTTYDGTFWENCKNSFYSLIKDTSTTLIEAAKVEESVIIV